MSPFSPAEREHVARAGHIRVQDFAVDRQIDRILAVAQELVGSG